jgi:hypothetical protein
MRKQAGKIPRDGASWRLLVLCLALNLVVAALCVGCEPASEPLPTLHHRKTHKKKAHQPRLPESVAGEEAASPSEPRSPSFQTVDNILANMEWGNIAFNVPASMNLEDTAVVQLVLSLRKPIDELKQLIEAQGEKEGTRIRVSNLMEARLTGLNFQITAVTPEKQAITGQEVTKWEWEIKPSKTGHYDLHLTLTALFTVEGISTSKALRTFDKTINVNVTWQQRTTDFFEKNWQWLWAVIIIPIAGWLWRRRRH